MAQLTPLAYHREIAARLQALEPRGWGLFASPARDGASPPAGPATPPPPNDGVDPTAAGGPVPDAVVTDAVVPDDDDLEQQLLRHAYRMEPGAHPRVHAAASRAAAALELDVPISIYQLEGAGGANASIAFRQREAVVGIRGNLLALLTDDELAACFGHELAHHSLWTADDGRILVADRFLGALSMDAGSPAWYLETARRFDLATELYADRGSLEACGSLEVAIAALVKVATGLAEVDPAAYLRQARDARPGRGADETSHPETVLRAWALERWRSGEGDSATATLLAPSLNIERLDLVDRERLEAVTRRLVLDALAVDWIRTDDVTSHARQFLVDVSPAPKGTGWMGRWSARVDADHGATNPVVTRLPDETPVETRRFLSYVLLDLATVDPAMDDVSLVEMAAVAREAGLGPTFEEVARKELALGTRAWDGIAKRAATKRLPAEGAQASEAAAPAAEAATPGPDDAVVSELEPPQSPTPDAPLVAELEPPHSPTPDGPLPSAPDHDFEPPAPERAP